MSFQRIGEGLPGLMARWLDDPELSWAVVQRTWTRVAGQTVARHARPLSLEAGVLRVGVDELAWLQTLQSMETELVTSLVAELGADLVREIEWSEADLGD